MENEQESKVYEVGFHIIPTLAEDVLASEFESIKHIIKAEGGEFISESPLELRVLAYPIAKTVKAIKSKYTKAYFGWIKFGVSPDAIAKIKTALDASETVIRHLIISTVKESTLWADKDMGRIEKATTESDIVADEAVIS